MYDFNEYFEKNRSLIDSDVENIMYKYIRDLDSTEFVLLSPFVVEFLNFKDDEENMIFIIENMEGIVRGNDLKDSGCNLVLKDGNIYIHKKFFQHFIIISDTPRIRRYLINFNRIIRTYNDLKSTKNPFVIKELTDQNYKKYMKCFVMRDDLISLIHGMYVLMDRQNKRKMCEYCALIEEIHEDIHSFEEQSRTLTEDFTTTYSSLKRLLSVF